MRAIRIEQYGGAEVLQYREDVLVPVPNEGEILVQVAYAGINFMDVHTRQGKYRNSRTYPVRIPCILGMEGAGVVVAIGGGVIRFHPGDRVTWCIAWGSYAEYACIPSTRAALLPDDIGLDVAAAVMFQGSTAHYLVEDVAGLAQASTCLIHAGSGSIGRLLIQMAKRRGATVYATASTEEKRRVALAQGADYVLPYDDGGFADAIRAATDGRGVDVVFDSLGRSTLRHSMRCARTKGLIVNYGNVSGSVTDLDPIELGEAGSLYLIRPRLADHMADAATVQRRADSLFCDIGEGLLTVDIEGEYRLEDVQMVHSRIEDRTQIGKAILRI